MSDHISEKLSYLTQIHTAWDGTEQRMSLRSEPRRYVSYDYTGMEAWQSQYLRMLLYSAQTQLIQFPMWHAACVLTDTQYKGQAVIQLPKEAMWGFRNIGALEIWSDDDTGGAKYDIKYMTSMAALGLKKQLVSTWPAYSTTFLPVFYAILQQDDSFSNMHAEISDMTVNLELIQNQDAPDFPAAFDVYHDDELQEDSSFSFGLPASYMGSDVWRFEPQWEDDMAAAFTRNANRLDYESGVFRFDLKSYNPSETRDVQYAGLTRPEIHNIERFFMRCKGQWKSFWAPTWLNDIELNGNQSSGQICLYANFTMFWKYYTKSTRRKRLVIFYDNGTCELLNVAGYSMDDTRTYGKVYLDTPLTHDIVKADVQGISFFCRYRFASDDLTMDYETPGVATTTLSFKEVDA